MRWRLAKAAKAVGGSRLLAFSVLAGTVLFLGAVAWG